MRCVNCGWDNQPNATTCQKCGQPLNVGGGSYNNVQPVSNAEAAPRPTVMNVSEPQQGRPTRVYNGEVPQQRKTIVQDLKKCPNCGYPVVGNFASCPNCGSEINAESKNEIKVEEKREVEPIKKNIAAIIPEKVTCQKCGSEVPSDSMYCPKCGERIHLATVRSIRHAPAEPLPHCSLTLLPEDEEDIEEKKLDYEGKSIILNRNNTEPLNRTITSKQQAELSFEDGKWYVVNHSELESTFILVNKKMELQPGDVLLLGDRKFRFDR